MSFLKGVRRFFFGSGYESALAKEIKVALEFKKGEKSHDDAVIGIIKKLDAFDASNAKDEQNGKTNKNFEEDVVQASAAVSSYFQEKENFPHRFIQELVVFCRFRNYEYHLKARKAATKAVNIAIIRNAVTSLSTKDLERMKSLPQSWPLEIASKFLLIECQALREIKDKSAIHQYFKTFAALSSVEYSRNRCFTEIEGNDVLGFKAWKGFGTEVLESLLEFVTANRTIAKLRSHSFVTITKDVFSESNWVKAVVDYFPKFSVVSAVSAKEVFEKLKSCVQNSSDFVRCYVFETIHKDMLQPGSEERLRATFVSEVFRKRFSQAFRIASDVINSLASIKRIFSEFPAMEEAPVFNFFELLVGHLAEKMTGTRIEISLTDLSKLALGQSFPCADKLAFTVLVSALSHHSLKFQGMSFANAANDLADVVRGFREEKYFKDFAEGGYLAILFEFLTESMVKISPIVALFRFLLRSNLHSFPANNLPLPYEFPSFSQPQKYLQETREILKVISVCNNVGSPFLIYEVWKMFCRFLSKKIVQNNLNLTDFVHSFTAAKPNLFLAKLVFFSACLEQHLTKYGDKTIVNSGTAVIVKELHQVKEQLGETEEKLLYGYNRVGELVRKHRESILSGCFTEKEYSEFLEKNSVTNGLLNALSLPEINEADIPDFQAAKATLNALRPLLHRLKELTGDSELTKVTQDIDVAVGIEHETVKYKALKDIGDKAQDLVQQLEDIELPDCTTPSNVKDFLAHFIHNRSGLFNGHLDMLSSSQQSNRMWVDVVKDLAFQIHRTFSNLLKLKVKVGTLKNLLSKLEERGVQFTVENEIRILQTFPPYGDASAPDVLAGIETALENVHLFTWLPSFVEAVEYLGSVEKNDNDFLLVQEAAKDLKSIDKMALDSIRERFAEMKVLFRGISANSFRLVRVASECKNLIQFFRDPANEFCSERGSKRFRELRDLITTRLQGDKFHSSLMNAVIASHSSLTPWLKEKRSLSATLAEVRTLHQATEDSVKFLQTANSNMSQITILFQNATAANMDNFHHLVEKLNMNGKVVVHLRRLSGEKSTFKLLIEKKQKLFRKLKEAQDDVEISEAQIEELNRRLVFASKKSGNEGSLIFRKKLRAANTLVQRFFELEASGYPMCQDRVLDFRFNESDMYDSERELGLVLVEWNELASSLREDFRIFALFSKFDLMTMIVLMSKTEIRGRLLKKFLGSIERNDPEEDHRLAASCLTRYFEAASLFLKQDFECDEKVIVTEMKAVEADCDEYARIADKLKDVAKALIRLPPEVDSKGSQSAYSLSPTSPSEVNVFYLLCKIFSDGGHLPTYFQILWCSRSTSVEQLNDFFEKVRLFADLDFVFVGVDLLQFRVRQALYKKQEEVSEWTSHGSVHYIFTDSGSTAHSQLMEVSEFEVTPELVAELKDRLSQMASDSNRPRVECVFGAQGIGKSHFIQRNFVLSSGKDTASITVAVNEEIDVPSLVQRFNSLPDKAVIVFNVSSYCKNYEVNRLFFDLVLCGGLYSETQSSLFCLKRNCSWKFIVELPCFDEEYSAETTGRSIETRVPLLSLISSEITEVTDENNPWTIDGMELEIAKWVKANHTGQIDMKKGVDEIKVDEIQDGDEARTMIIEHLLKLWLVDVVPEQKKIVRFSLQLLKMRFEGFKSFSFKWNRDVPQLGSTLFRQFSDEVNHLCKNDLNCSWSEFKQPFLLTEQGPGVEPSYCVFYKGAYETLRPELRRVTEGGEKGLKKKEEEDKKRLKKEEAEGIKGLPPYQRLHEYIGWVLHLRPETVDALVRKKRFVLTEEFAYKIILLHQRKEARASVVIEGETGVGKTFLLEMYAMLLNEGMLRKKDNKDNPRLLSRLCHWTSKAVLPLIDKADLAKLEEPTLAKRLDNEDFDDSGLIEVWREISKGPKGEEIQRSLIDQINAWFQDLRLLLEPHGKLKMWLDKEAHCETANLVQAVLQWELYPLFHKLLIHPGLTVNDVMNFLKPIVAKAEQLPQIEFIIFFDEVNTASCLGLFKEILIDGTIDGHELPENLFFVSAINPKVEEDENERTDVDLGNPEDLGRRVYHVHKLPSSMETLKWKFPGMDDRALKGYIERKIVIQEDTFGNDLEGKPILLDASSRELFSKLLLSAHDFFRREDESKVSQRDVKRVFELCPFMCNYALTDEEKLSYSPQSLLKKCFFLSIALVYYLRLPEKSPSGGQSREQFEKFGNIRLYKSFKEDVTKVIDNFVTREHFVFPPGVALNRALKENVFATVACVQTKVPLAIIGAPGSSKTLSFNIVRDNLHGPNHSPKEFCKRFYAVDPFFYQCSEYSTPSEIESTFAKASERQKFYADRGEQTRCVVLLDEAGLSLKNEKLMVLKVLHPLLDDPQVSFVAISNQPFDSANANRMATVFRSLATEDDLLVLAEGCLGADFKQSGSDSELKDFVLGLCDSYTEIIKDDKFKNFFHYRDFIYTLRLIHRHSCLHDEGERVKNLSIHPLLLLRALEENMRGSGTEDFKEVVAIFFENVQRRLRRSYEVPAKEDYRDVLTILQSALNPDSGSPVTKVPTGHPLSPRFIMIIDPSDDDTAVKLLFQSGLLSPEDGKVFRLSEFSKDQTPLHDIQVLSDIRNALEDGLHTILINTDRIHGSLYDLLNQNCRIVEAGKDDGEAEIYANIPIGEHTFPSRVHPRFRCLVILKKALLESTPAPFLSRFSKYLLSPTDFLTFFVDRMSESQRSVLSFREPLASFADFLGAEELIGLDKENTISSLLLSYLSSEGEMSDRSFEIWNKTPPNVQDVIQRHTNDHYEMLLAALCAKLLQIVPPEGLILKLPTIGSPWNDMFCKLYFNVIQQFSLRSLAIRLMNKEFQQSKVLAYCRTNPSVSLFSTSDRHRSEIFGDEAMAVCCRDIKAFSSQEDFEHFLINDFYKNSHQKLLLLTVGALEITDIHVIFHLVESVHAQNEKKAVLVLFHFRSDKLFSNLVYPAQFLNGWDTVYLDICDDRAATQVKHCVSALLSNNAEQPQEVFASRDIERKAEREAIQYFCSKHGPAPVRPTMLQALPSSVKKFYQYFPKSGQKSREDDVRRLLEEAPSVFEFISKQFAKQLSPSEIGTLLYRLASNVFTQGTSGFAEAVEHRLLSQFKLFASYYLLAIAKNFGLAALSSFIEKGVDCNALPALLDLIPKLKTLLETAMQRKNRGPVTNEEVFLPEFPLRGFFQRRLDAIAKGTAENDLVATSKLIDQRLKRRLAEIRLAMIESEEIFELWESDALKRLCIASQSAYSDEGFRVVRHWFRCEFTEDCGSMIAYCQATAHLFKDDLILLYSAARSISGLESPIDVLCNQTRRGKIMKEAVRCLFKALWQKLCSIVRSDTDSFIDSRKVWLSTFRFVYSFFPFSTSLSVYESKEYHVEMMSVAYSYMMYQSTATSAEETMAFLSELIALADGDDESYDFKRIIDILSFRYGDTNDEDILLGIKDVLQEIVFWFVQNQSLTPETFGERKEDLLKILEIVNFGICNEKVLLHASLSLHVLTLLKNKVKEENFVNLVNESTRTLRTGDGRAFYVPRWYGEEERKQTASAFKCPISDVWFGIQLEQSQNEEDFDGEDVLESKRKAYGILCNYYDFVQGDAPRAQAPLSFQLEYAVNFQAFLRALSVYCKCHGPGENFLQKYEGTQIVQDAFQYLLDANKSGYSPKHYTAFIHNLIQAAGLSKAADLLSNCSDDKLRSDGKVLAGKGEQRRTFSSLSFMTTHSSFAELQNLRSMCNNLSSKFASSNASDVVRHCAEVHRSSSTIGVYKSESCLKMCIALWCSEVDQPPMIDKARSVAKQSDALVWEPFESKFIQFILDPKPFLDALGKNIALHSVFCERQKVDEDTKFCRDFIVQHVALVIGGGMKSYFASVLKNPRSLDRTFPFGRASYCNSQNYIHSFKLDCFNIYSDDGDPSELSSTLTVSGQYLATAFNFAAVLMSLVLNFTDANSLFANNILSSGLVNAVPGSTVTERAVNFCWQRVKTPLLWLQGKLKLRSEQMSLWLSRSLERFFVVQGQSTLFGSLYSSGALRDDAERHFEKNVVQFTCERFQLYQDEMAQRQNQNQKLVVELRAFSNSLPLPAAFDEFRDSLVHACASEESSLETLRFLVSRMQTFQRAKELVLPLAAMFLFLHDELSQTAHSLDDSMLCQVDLYIEKLDQKSGKKAAVVKEMIRKGVDAFNVYHKLCQGNFQAGACDVRSEFAPITDDTPLRYCVNVKDESDENQLNLVYRVLDRLVVQQKDLLIACENLKMTEDNRLTVILEACSLEDDISMTEVLRSGGSGIVQVNFPEFCSFVEGCSREVYLEEIQGRKVEFDLERIQRIALTQYVVSGRRIDLESFNRTFQLRKEVDVEEQFEEAGVADDVSAKFDLSENFKKSISDSCKSKIARDFSERPYQERLALCENAEKLLEILSTSRDPIDSRENLLSFANERGIDLPESDAISDLSLANALNLYELFVTHTHSQSQVSKSLPAAISQALTRKQEEEIKRKFLDYDLSEPAILLTESNRALRILHESIQLIAQNPDEKLLSVLTRTPTGLSSRLLNGVPDDVMCRQLAPVMDLFAGYASSARQKKFEQGSKLTWTISQGDEQKSEESKNRFMSFRKFADRQFRRKAAVEEEGEGAEVNARDLVEEDEGEEDDNLRLGFYDDDDLSEAEFYERESLEFPQDATFGEERVEAELAEDEVSEDEGIREDEEVDDLPSAEVEENVEDRSENGEENGGLEEEEEEEEGNGDKHGEEREDESLELQGQEEEFFYSSSDNQNFERDGIRALISNRPFAFEHESAERIALNFRARVKRVKIKEFVPMFALKVGNDRAKVQVHNLPGQKKPETSVQTPTSFNKKYKGKRFANECGLILDDDQFPKTKKKTDPAVLYYVEKASSVVVTVKSTDGSTPRLFEEDFQSSATVENVISALLRHLEPETAKNETAVMFLPDGTVVDSATRLDDLDEEVRTSLFFRVGARYYYHCHFPSGEADDICLVPEKLETFLSRLAMNEVPLTDLSTFTEKFFCWPSFSDERLETADNFVEVRFFPFDGVLLVKVSVEDGEDVNTLPALFSTTTQSVLGHFGCNQEERSARLAAKRSGRFLPMHAPLGHTCRSGAELLLSTHDDKTWSINAAYLKPHLRTEAISVIGDKTCREILEIIQAANGDEHDEDANVHLTYGLSSLRFSPDCELSADRLGSTPVVVVEEANARKEKTLSCYLYNSHSLERKREGEHSVDLVESDVRRSIPSRMLSQFVSFFSRDPASPSLLPCSYPFCTVEETNVIIGRNTDISNLVLSPKPMATICLGYWTTVPPKLCQANIAVEKSGSSLPDVHFELPDEGITAGELKLVASALLGEKKKRCGFTSVKENVAINDETFAVTLQPQADENYSQIHIKMTIEEGPEEADLILRFEDQRIEVEVEVGKTYDEVLTELFEHLGMDDLIDKKEAYEIALNDTPMERPEVDSESESEEKCTLKELLAFVDSDPLAQIVVSVSPIFKNFKIRLKGSRDQEERSVDDVLFPLNATRAEVLEKIAKLFEIVDLPEASFSVEMNGTSLAEDDWLLTTFEFLPDEEKQDLVLDVEIGMEGEEARKQEAQ
ncbi:uncharacterized protein [Oscarella lobularis]|uniref:uncharacterized protein n=1 Tax=Oscarella lobularis TaxID=121494 RepID=UPI00331344C6